MRLFDIVPLIAVATFLVFALRIAARDGDAGPQPNGWVVPAVLAVLFLCWSGYAIATEGLLGFVAEHRRNAWGNQIAMDLLLGIGAAWALIVPGAKRLGMRPLPWLLLILCTGSIGFMTMLSRFLYLRERSSHAG